MASLGGRTCTALRMHGVAARQARLGLPPMTCSSSSQMVWLLHENRAIRRAISFGSATSALPAPAMYSLDGIHPPVSLILRSSPCGYSQSSANPRASEPLYPRGQPLRKLPQSSAWKLVLSVEVGPQHGSWSSAWKLVLSMEVGTSLHCSCHAEQA